ncbi:MAG: hypothetical protein U5Q44_04625 [Dehalococcoidia bacterium]|nr:hypothetical protein [Dehalococcoidia bacterium]
MVENMQNAVEAMESGDVQGLDEIDNVDFDPELEERLTAAAENVEECEGLF